jgi:hypothetical protein
MAGDRYTKAVLTVIAVCLVWLSLGGPSLMTPVSAQGDGQRVMLSGWVDEKGSVVAFPQAPPIYDYSRPRFGNEPPASKPRASWPLPITEAVK